MLKPRLCGTIGFSPPILPVWRLCGANPKRRQAGIIEGRIIFAKPRPLPLSRFRLRLQPNPTEALNTPSTKRGATQPRRFLLKGRDFAQFVRKKFGHEIRRFYLAHNFRDESHLARGRTGPTNACEPGLEIPF